MIGFYSGYCLALSIGLSGGGKAFLHDLEYLRDSSARRGDGGGGNIRGRRRGYK